MMTRIDKIKAAVKQWFRDNAATYGYQDDVHENYLTKNRTHRFHFQRGVINFQRKIGGSWKTIEGFRYGPLATYTSGKWVVSNDFINFVIEQRSGRVTHGKRLGK